MSDAQPGAIDAASKVVVLAFDLVDATLPETPAMLARALQSPQVQDSVKKVLLTFAKSKSKPGCDVCHLRGRAEASGVAPERRGGCRQ